MNDGLPTDNVTLDSLVRCPECLGMGWCEYEMFDGVIDADKCERCEGDGVVPLHWAMENVA